MNLDETAVKTWMAPGKGLIAKPMLSVGRRGRRVAPATRKQQRGCVSHIAFVCDNPDIQPRLPHVFIGNAAVLPVYIQREIEPQLFSNVFLVRRKSAWVDAGYMVEIMKLLGAILAPFLSNFQPILLMDALPAHLAPKVFRAAARCGIWVVVVPAKLTYLIQPADTHVFYKYKMYLRRRYMEAMASSAEGALELRAVLMAMNDGVRYVCQAHDWSKAFDENGFGHKQRLVRQSVILAAGLELPLAVPASVPTLAQLQSLWPKGKDVPLEAVFAPFLTPPPVLANSRTAQNIAPPDLAPDSWSERLRPRRSGSFVFPPVYEVDADSPTRGIGAADSGAWPMVEAAQPPVPAHTPRIQRWVPRPIAASRPSEATSSLSPPRTARG